MPNTLLTEVEHVLKQALAALSEEQDVPLSTPPVFDPKRHIKTKYQLTPTGTRLYHLVAYTQKELSAFLESVPTEQDNQAAQDQNNFANESTGREVQRLTENVQAARLLLFISIRDSDEVRDDPEGVKVTLENFDVVDDFSVVIIKPNPE